MKIIQETDLRHFKFWSGGKDRADKLTDSQLDQVESILEDTYPDGMTDTQINDLFWFGFDTIASWLGYKDGEYFDADVKDDDIDDAEDWFNDIDDAGDALVIANFDEDGFTHNEDGCIPIDEVFDKFQDWWNNLSDIEKVQTMRKNS